MRLIILFLLTFSIEWIWAQAKPNFIIILSDDAGYADFGFQGNNSFKTPNIDSIAENGVTFTNGYVSGCVCSPSRAGLITGRYQARFGHENNLPPGNKLGLPTSERTFADILKQAGYKTAVIGKWHLGYEDEYHPNNRGFDWFYGCLQGSRNYWRIKQPSKHRVIQFNGQETEEVDQYLTDRLGDNAVKFINENKSSPFFMYLSFTAVHGPYQAKESDVKVFNKSQLSKSRRNLAGMTKSLDDNVGKVLKALADNKIFDNTIVTFLNDNGGTGPAINTPLNGKKGTLYEGGTRVPFCIQWPARFKDGQKFKQPVIALDLLPTAIEAAGINLKDYKSLDGLSLIPYLTGKEKMAERTLFWRKHTGAETAWAALRKGEWKLHKQVSGYKLFNLTNDVSEQNDIKDNHKDIFRHLKGELAQWESEMKPPLFGKGSVNSKDK